MMIEKCSYTQKLQGEIDATTDLREKLKLQVQFFDSIEPLLCGDGSDKICCDPGKKMVTKIVKRC